MSYHINYRLWYHIPHKLLFSKKNVVCHTTIIRTYAICALGAGAGKDKGTMGTSKGKQEKPKRKPGRPRVENKIYKAPPDADYYRADDIAEIMGLSRSRSYKLIQDMRADLMSEGKLLSLIHI